MPPDFLVKKYQEMLSGGQNLLSNIGSNVGYLIKGAQQTSPSVYQQNLSTAVSRITQPVTQAAFGVNTYLNQPNSQKIDRLISSIPNVQVGGLVQQKLQDYANGPQYRIAPQIDNQVFRLAAGIPEGLINSPQTSLKGAVELGTNLRQGTVTPRNLVSSTAKMADLPLNIATFGGGGAAAKGVLGQAGKQTIKQVLKEGALQGAKYGALFGGLGELQQVKENQSLPEIVGNTTIGAGEGAATGALLGAVISGGVHGAGAAYKALEDRVTKAFMDVRKLPEPQARAESRVLLRNKLGQFAKTGTLIDTEPITYTMKVRGLGENYDVVKQDTRGYKAPRNYGDIQEALGWGRFGEKLPQLGNSTRAITQEEAAALAKKQPKGVNQTINDVSNPEITKLQRSIQQSQDEIAKLKNTLETGRTGPFKDNTPKKYIRDRIAAEESYIKLYQKKISALSTPPQVPQPKGQESNTIPPLPDNLKMEHAYGENGNFLNYNINELEKQAKVKGYNLMDALVKRVDSQTTMENKVAGMESILDDLYGKRPQPKGVGEVTAQGQPPNLGTTSTRGTGASLETVAPKRSDQISAQPQYSAIQTVQQNVARADNALRNIQNAVESGNRDLAASLLGEYDAAVTALGKNSKKYPSIDKVTNYIEGAIPSVQYEVAATKANLNKELRSSVDPNLVRRVRTAKSKFANGDIESIRKSEYGKDVNKAIEQLREVPQYAGLTDEEVLKVLQDYPSASETKVPKQVTLKTQNTENLYSGRPQTQAEANAEVRSWEEQINGGSFKPYKGGKTPATEKLPTETLSGAATKDQWPLAYQLSTVDRNIESTFGKEAGKIKDFFTRPIVNNETARAQFVTDLKTSLSNVFKGISKGSKEDYAAGDYIEGNITLDQLRQQFPSKWQNIVKVSEEGRAVYKDLLNRINGAITKFGYDPIPERQNYVTHTAQLSEFANRFGSFLNFAKEELPTEMSAIHLDTKPGRQFFKFGLQRQGGSTHEGLITALEKYIEPASQQIFHTEDIQRGRALVDYLTKSSTGTQTQRLSNFNSYLSQYVDSLAGKKHILDRPVEKIFGRSVLSLADGLKKRVGVNMIVGNLSSALMHELSLTQTLATTDKPAFIRGLYKATVSPLTGDFTKIDGVQSGFLTRNFPKKFITTNFGQKAEQTLSWLFDTNNRFVSKILVASKFEQMKARGLSPQEAMKVADEYVSRALGDRSTGQQPLVFDSKTLGFVSQFMGEVNNQMQFVARDIPNNAVPGSDLGKAGIASAIGQFILYSYLFNNVYEQVMGRRPQVDIIHAGLKAYDDYRSGKDWKQIVNPLDRNTAVGEVVQNLPFSGIAGGRYPLSSALPDFNKIGKGDIAGGLINPATYLLSPIGGGGQIKKTLEGLNSYNQGYVGSPDAVKFPVNQSLPNLLRMGVFGQYSTPEARNYFSNNTTALGKNDSAMFTSIPQGDRNSFYQSVLTNRQGEADLKKLNEGGLVKTTAPGNATQPAPDYIKPLSDGRFAVQIGTDNKWTGFNTQDEAQKAYDEDQFDKSGKNSAVVNDLVYRKSKTGDITTQLKIDYDTELNTQKLENAKSKDDLETWMTLAQQQLTNYQTQLQNPTLDELEKMQLQQKVDALVKDVANYKSYGGFKKPKKPTLKKLSIKAPKVKPLKLAKAKLPKVKRVSSPKLKAVKAIKVKSLTRLA